MMAIAALYVLGVAAAFVVWRIADWLWFKPKKIEKFLRGQGLKGNAYRFVVGDLKEMVQVTTEAKSGPMSLNHDIVHRLVPFFHKSVTIHGKNYFIWLGTKPMVNISESTMIREVFANYNHFQKPSNRNPFTNFPGGLLFAETDQWLKHRKIITPAFHVEKLKHMAPAFYVSCSEMIQKWRNLVKESSCEVDVWPYLQAFSADVISRTAFGSSFQEGKKIFELLTEQAPLVMKARQSVYIPGSRFLPTRNNKMMKKIDRELKASITSIIDKRITAMKTGETSNSDLLSILLEANYKEIKQQGNVSFGLSNDEVIEECKLFYFAGQETTGNMLCWAMILLAQYTEWQERARDEVLQVFGNKRPDIDGFSHLKVINMIINEVLRLYPPAPAYRRYIHEETKLGNLTLPAGTLIRIDALSLHHDKDIWGDDVNEFNPERFSEGVSQATKGHLFYLPFGGGPRVCIGQNFAVLEAKTALAMILQHFSFQISPSYSHAPHNILTIQPQFGAHLILHKL